MRLSELLNLVGLSTGVALYAMLLTMVLRVRRRHDPLLLSTALLGLVWNLCALAVYELPKIGFLGPFPWLTAVGFSALGFLPAVVVHSVVRGERAGVHGGARRALAAGAYIASTVAAVLQVRAASTGAVVPSELAMRLLTYIFIASVVPLATATRRQPGGRRAIWAAALAAFAVSALHLSQLHPGEASWPVELLGHHASVPLAFAILYQDYPFALADLFLKRALTLLVLVTTAFMTIAAFGARSTAFGEFVRDPRRVGLLVLAWVASALLYPVFRRGSAWFVDTVVLRRPDFSSLRATAARRVPSHDTVPALLDDVCELLKPAMSASSVTWKELTAPADQETAEQVRFREHATAVVIVPVAELPRYAIVLSGLVGGRRLLSDDLAALEAIASLAGRRIDGIRITRERYARELREQEIGKLAAEAELRALRAQVNPHFLFNTLTTIGYLIQTAPPRALDTLMRLTSLLRAVLSSEGEFTTLGREIELIEAYLEIEHARFEDRLRVRLDVPHALRTIRMPPLLLQPLVENAVKHGIAPLLQGGQITVEAAIETTANGSPELYLVVRDTGAGASAVQLDRGRQSGVGLQNIERRLARYYGTHASLTIHSVPRQGTVVEIRLPSESSPIAAAPAERAG